MFTPGEIHNHPEAHLCKASPDILDHLIDSSMLKKYVQYGCGFSAPEQWLNFDASPTLRFERLPIIGSLYTKNKSDFHAMFNLAISREVYPSPATPARVFTVLTCLSI